MLCSSHLHSNCETVGGQPCAFALYYTVTARQSSRMEGLVSGQIFAQAQGILPGMPGVSTSACDRERDGGAAEQPGYGGGARRAEPRGSQGQARNQPGYGQYMARLSGGHPEGIRWVSGGYVLLLLPRPGAIIPVRPHRWRGSLQHKQRHGKGVPNILDDSGGASVTRAVPASADPGSRPPSAVLLRRTGFTYYTSVHWPGTGTG